MTPTELRALYAEYGSQRELARRLGVSRVQVSRMMREAGVEVDKPGTRSPWRSSARSPVGSTLAFRRLGE